jgi:hypothetical protein
MDLPKTFRSKTTRANPTQRLVTGGGLITVEEARIRTVDREEREGNEEGNEEGKRA